MAEPLSPALHELLAHTRWVESLANSLVRDPNAAADLAQSTLLAALQQSTPPENPRAWLRRVMHNQFRERFRRERSRPGVETRAARQEVLPGADELVLRAESERRIVSAVLALDEPHRSTLLLRYFEDLSPEEIARRSGATLATISSRITRAHARLRERLGDQDPRRDWLAAIAPILIRGSDALPAPLESSAFHASRVLVMGTTSKVLIVTAVLAIALWFGLRERKSEELASSALAQESRNADTSLAKEPSSPPAPTPVAEAVRKPVAVAENSAEVVKPEAPLAPTPAQFGRIFGQIFRPDGRPAPKRKLRLLRSNIGPEKYATTDDEGKFDERELGPGTWSLATWPDRQELDALGKSDEDTIEGFTYMTQRTVDLEVGKEIEVILGKPPAAGVHVSGRLLLEGVPIDGYMTWLPMGPDSMDRQKVATASETKGYDTLLDTPGRYLVICIHGEPRIEFTVDVPAGPEFTRDFEFPTQTLRGKVRREDGAPVVGARIDLTIRGGMSPRHPASNITYSHASDADGAFTFECVPAARYALAVHAGVVGESKEPVAAKSLGEIEVKPGADPAPIEVVLQAGAAITGIIRNRTGGNAYTDVFVIDGEGAPLNPLAGVQSEKDGTFKLFALAPGSYGVLAANGDAWSDLIPLIVPAQGELPKLELELEPAAKLTIDISGQPPAWIDLRSSSGVCFSALFDKHLFNRTLTRDWSSTSFVYRVPPGEYRAILVGSSGKLAEQKVMALGGESLTVDLSRSR